MKVFALIGLYLIAIVAANLSVARFGPSAAVVNAFLFIGLDLSARDWLHEAWRGHGRWWRMGALILAGSLLSWLLNAGAGRIALASCAAFAGAGIVDAAIYAALGRRAYLVRANGSNIVSGLVDSLIFPALAFGALLPAVVLGQWIAKVAGGALWAWLLRGRMRATTEQAV